METLIKVTLVLTQVLVTNWTPITVGTNRLEVGEVSRQSRLDLSPIGGESNHVFRVTKLNAPLLVRRNTNPPMHGWLLGEGITNIIVTPNLFYTNVYIMPLGDDRINAR